MSSISDDIYSESDINFLQNEKFDFDLPFSPTNGVEGIMTDEDEEDDEVFFGDVGFTEQCMSTRVASLQDEEYSLVKPLSPLSGEQVVEVFTEATKLALHIERLSTDASETNQSNSNSEGTASTSSSHLQSSTSSYLPLRKSSSDDSMPGKSKQCIEVPEIPDDGHKENIDPVVPPENTIKHGTVSKVKKSKITGAIFAPKQLNSPVQKIKNGTSRIGSAKRSSRLPRSKNTEKSTSAFSSPIKQPLQPRFSNGSVENTSSDDGITNVASVGTKSARKTIPQSISQGLNVLSTKKTVTSEQGTPVSSTRNKKTTTPALTKRNIFRSSESLDDHGTKSSKSKLPISGLSKIPAVLSRRRRSNSTSSVSSQSSTSSQTTAQDDDTDSKLTNKNQPCTKPSLTSSMASFRRSSKTKLENGVEKKTQPVKALPLKTDQDNMCSTVSTVDYMCDKVKMPLSGTPVRQSQSSLPIKRRSSIKKPNTTGKKTIPQSLKKQKSNEQKTPQKSNDEVVANVINRKARRSLLPTPRRDTSTRSRIPTDGGTTMPIPMKLAEPVVGNSGENRSNSSENIDLMKGTDSSDMDYKCDTQSTVDDLLQLDTTICMVNGIVPMQPNPIPQANLIDFGDI